MLIQSCSSESPSLPHNPSDRDTAMTARTAPQMPVGLILVALVFGIVLAASTLLAAPALALLAH